MDPSYSPLTLPQNLQRVRTALLGENSDTAYRNVMLKTLMTVLHSTEFASYVAALDPRITYLDHQSIAALHSNSVVLPQGFTISTGTVVGTPICNVTNPRMEWLWHVTVVSHESPFTVNVRWEQGRKEQNFTVGFTAGLSEFIPLIGQPGLFLQVTNTMLQGDQWSVSLLALPTIELSDTVAALEKCGPAAIEQLFTPRTAPRTDFEKLWKDHPYLNYKLSGLLLALIYRLEELRISG